VAESGKPLFSYMQAGICSALRDKRKEGLF